ncbi:MULTISPECIES: MFS transporter [unclassified Streptomyces]|uniref:MFS transporter n=1 Tax=Streptomyces sp. NBC_00119 TaxID=2975659 RepID=A0AAU1UCT0_9ACTN|nr:MULTISPECIES: MFS transporter [unclassified Streptomyces]MCX4646034.1 MFS transporter [Streptomyces sp. NBC_01446]MCX5318658.1 MFS transporter [Streptomyces sp. NBC_00120]
MTVTAPLTGTPAPEKPAHRDGNVLRWLGAYGASMIGDNIYYVALSWAAVQSGSPSQAGLVMAVSAAPRALLMLGGGVIADRLGPRRIVIAGDAVRSAAVLGVAGLFLATQPGLWPLTFLGLVFGIVDALFLPAVGALPARVTGRDQLARVQGMRGLAVRLANVVGAPLGGLGVALGGPAAAFGAAGLLFAISLPLLMSLRIRDLPDVNGKSGAPARNGLADGLRYIRRHSVLAPLIVVIALSDLGFVGPLNVGLTLLADQRGWGASGMGSVLAGFGVGAGAASLLLAVRGRVPRAGLVLAATMGGGSVAIGALAFVPHLVAAVAVALVIGLLAGLSGTLCGALTQTHADPAYIGRVTAVTSLSSLGLVPLTMPLTGAAVGLWGTGPVFVASAAICALAGVYGLCRTPLRRAELPA